MVLRELSSGLAHQCNLFGRLHVLRTKFWNWRTRLMEKKSRFKTNMGFMDRMVRLCAGIGLILVGSLAVQGTIGTVLLCIGILAVLTSAIGFCPGYVPFGISTVGFPFARSGLMSRMMTQCCSDTSTLSDCCGTMERTRRPPVTHRQGRD